MIVNMIDQIGSYHFMNSVLGRAVYLSLLHIPLNRSLRLCIMSRRTEMVASKNEIKTIVEILRQYWPDVSIEMMLNQVWEDVGERTDNESLKQTIGMMLQELSESIDWMKKT